jgi:hypothetical protein
VQSNVKSTATKTEETAAPTNRERDETTKSDGFQRDDCIQRTYAPFCHLDNVLLHGLVQRRAVDAVRGPERDCGLELGRVDVHGDDAARAGDFGPLDDGKALFKKEKESMPQQRALQLDSTPRERERGGNESPIERTTAPRPKTATDELGSTLHVFRTAPRPVLTPHPNRHTLVRSAAMLILAHEISASTVYSDMVEHPMKW